MAGSFGGRLAPDHSRVARVRAHQHYGTHGLCPSGRDPLRAAPRRPAQGSWFSRQSLHHAVERRHRNRGRHRRESDRHGGVGPGERGAGRRCPGPADRRAQDHRARHRRHHRQVLAGRERQDPHHPPTIASSGRAPIPATRSAPRSSRSWRSATAGARSPGSMPVDDCTSARKVPAPCPGPPPTAAAVSGRPRPMPTSSPAASIPRISSAGDHARHGERRARLRTAGREARRNAAGGCPRHHPHRERQHGQCAEARFAQQGLRSARVHADSLWRWRCDARSGARRRVAHGEGDHSDELLGVLRLGMLMSDLRRDYLRTQVVELKAQSVARRSRASSPT